MIAGEHAFYLTSVVVGTYYFAKERFRIKLMTTPYRQKTKAWYDLARWKKRSRYQLRCFPWCAMCLEHGVYQLAVCADHIVPHRGDFTAFVTGDLQSLCAGHHSSSKAQLEHSGFVCDIGIDGWPVDPLHPQNVASKKQQQRQG